MKIYKCDVCGSTRPDKDQMTNIFFGLNKSTDERIGNIDCCQECYVPISTVIHELKKGGL